MLGDGVPWIWNLKANRWPQARKLLDFWHGSQHLWSLGRAGNGMDEAKAQRWVQKRMDRLCQGQEQKVLKKISALQVSRSQSGQIVRKEKNYFVGQSQRMNYKEMMDRG